MLRLEPSGSEAIAELRFRGALLGASSALANSVAPMSALTITECTVTRLSSREFLDLVQTNPDFLREMLFFISQQKQEQSIRYTRHAAFSARAQLAELLLKLWGEFGTERNGEMRLATPLSKQDMAGWVGIAPQHLSFILREMKNDGLLAEEKGWIIFLDLERLKYEAETGLKTNSTSLLPKRE